LAPSAEDRSSRSPRAPFPHRGLPEARRCSPRELPRSPCARALPRSPEAARRARADWPSGSRSPRRSGRAPRLPRRARPAAARPPERFRRAAWQRASQRCRASRMPAHAQPARRKGWCDAQSALGAAATSSGINLLQGREAWRDRCTSRARNGRSRTRQRRSMRQALSIGIVFLGVGATAPAARAGARAAFLYALSDPTERAQYGADLAWDRFNSELYVTGPGVVSVFGDSGMMVHQFAEDPDAGIPIGVAPVGDRELVVLTLWQGATRVYRCNFRGDPIARIPLPAEFESFGANGIATANGNVYLVNKQALRVLALGLDGSKVGYFDLGPQ